MKYVSFTLRHGLTNLLLTCSRMNRRKADFKFAYRFLEDDV